MLLHGVLVALKSLQAVEDKTAQVWEVNKPLD